MQASRRTFPFMYQWAYLFVLYLYCYELTGLGTLKVALPLCQWPYPCQRFPCFVLSNLCPLHVYAQGCMRWKSLFGAIVYWLIKLFTFHWNFNVMMYVLNNMRNILYVYLYYYLTKYMKWNLCYRMELATCTMYNQTWSSKISIF